MRIGQKVISGSLAMVLLIALSAAGAFYYQNKMIRNVIINKINDKRNHFWELREQDTKTLASALEVILQDETFKDIYLQKDREMLFDYGQPLFEKLKNKYGITHFYFILPDGHCFLRLHNREIYGDLIERFTFLKARETKSAASGIELGKTAFALRVVMPYYKGDELIGYVELGEEIGHFLEILRKDTNDEFAIIADKKYLGREEWVSVREAAHSRDNWDDLAEHVIISDTTKGKTAAAKEYFTEENLERVGERREIYLETIKDQGRAFALGGFEIIDAAGHRAGEALALIEITSEMGIAREAQAALLVIAVILFVLSVGVNLSVSVSILGPITKLKEAAFKIGQGRLDAEIEIKSKDEIGELGNSFDKMRRDLKKYYDSNLEEVVNEKTEKLAKILTKSEEQNKRLEDTKKAMMNLLEDVEAARKDLGREKEAIERARIDLERSNKELEQFAYVASHDLQEPLRMVTSYVQLLARRYGDKLNDKDAQDFIGFAVDGSIRMQQLINDLLTFSRVGTRGKPFEPTDCEDVLKKALINLEMAIKDNNAMITHEPLPELQADKNQLIQVFQNLIGNAIKFHKKGLPPQIDISTRLALLPAAVGSAAGGRKEWIFSVKDNGIGFDMRYAERAFQIFQRLHTRGEYPGTGIGLSVCKKIVERHGGRIWVESEPDKGSTFYFTIPAGVEGKVGGILVESGKLEF